MKSVSELQLHLKNIENLSKIFMPNSMRIILDVGIEPVSGKTYKELGSKIFQDDLFKLKYHYPIHYGAYGFEGNHFANFWYQWEFDTRKIDEEKLHEFVAEVVSKSQIFSVHGVLWDLSPKGPSFGIMPFQTGNICFSEMTKTHMEAVYKTGVAIGSAMDTYLKIKAIK